MPGKGILDAERKELAERFCQFEKEWILVNPDKEPREFAQKLKGPGAYPSDLEDWRTGKYPPNQGYELQMAVMGLNTTWFHTGRGTIMRPMHVPATPDELFKNARALEHGSTAAADENE